MVKPGGIQRLISFTYKPLLVALFISLLLHWTDRSKGRKPLNPHPHISRSLVIASTTSSNLTWLTPALTKSHWTPNIYVADSVDSPLTVPVNKGNEAMVYLTYIIDNYNSLPDVVFFHHDHSQGWHQLFSSAYELANLNPLTIQKYGYVSTRCLPGCENVIELSGGVSTLENLKDMPRDVQISSVLRKFNEGVVPSKIAGPCCAQFAVSRQAIFKRPLRTWKALREWLIETSLDSRSSGRVLEYTWHLWFGMEPVHCPEEGQCLCEVYGVGNCL